MGTCLLAAPAEIMGQQRPAQPGPSGSGTWRVLFDGTSTAAWRGYRSDDMPSGWQIVDGALTRVAAASDIITRDEFGDFELTLEWQVKPGGNSGIMFRVTEEQERTYHSGPEMQVLDDALHPDNQSPFTAAGSDYALYAAPPGAVRPAGEWNAVRVLVQGSHVEYWLNGIKTVEYELWSPDWEARVKASKFAQWPDFGRARRGHIALQDHGDWVAYRNIRVREIN